MAKSQQEKASNQAFWLFHLFFFVLVWFSSTKRERKGYQGYQTSWLKTSTLDEVVESITADFSMMQFTSMCDAGTDPQKG